MKYFFSVYSSNTSTFNDTTSSTYAYPLDLLRIYAAMAVVLYHWDDSLFAYGFLGVDVFLLISGYLVGGAIYNRFVQKNFFFADFYLSRLIRLLPSLYLVLTFSTLAMFFLLTPMELERYGRALLSTVLNISNVYFFKSTDYFNPVSMNNPLIHTWSLSLEEQFYLFFPIILYIFSKLGINLFKGCVFVFAISFILYFSYVDSLMSFYLLPFRVWEFGVGVLLYLFSKKYNLLICVGFRFYIFCLVLISFLWGIAAINKSDFSSNLAFASTLIVTCLYIASMGNVSNSLVFKSTASIKYLGGMSYSVYLWHMPVAALFSIHSIKTGAWFVIYIFVVFGLAFFTYQFLELKVRYASRKILVLKVLAVVSVVFCCVGSLFHFSGGLEKTWKGFVAPEKATHYEIFSQSKKHSYGHYTKCRKNYRENIESFEMLIQECSDSVGGPIIVVIGDSHGEDIFHALSNALPKQAVLGFARGGCRVSEMNPSCDFNKLAEILKYNKKFISHVIYAQAYFYLFDNAGFPSQRSYVNGLLKLPADEFSKESISVHQNSILSIKFYLEELARSQLNVIYLGGWIDPMHELTFTEYLVKKVPAQKIQSVKMMYSLLDAHLFNLFEYSPVHFYSLISLTPPFYGVEGYPNYSDADHLSMFGEAYLGARIASTLGL